MQSNGHVLDSPPACVDICKLLTNDKGLLARYKVLLWLN
uniref:Uncharacterized protein n=1 Tax=Arundo donax TaxID=35708 RepID=A0A0A9EWM2_ARUDO